VHAKGHVATTYHKLTKNQKRGGGEVNEKCLKVLLGSTKEEGGGFGKR